MEKYLITHFMITPIEERGWVRTSYVVKKGDKYYVGENGKRGFEESQFEKMVKGGSLKKLEEPIEMVSGQCLWVTPESEVYLASAKDPRGTNNDKVYVGRI